MISKVVMKNFKCYKDCAIRFKNFNVLCGPNSSGKSSIIQAILFLLQNIDTEQNNLITNGKFVHFDEFDEIKNYEISATKPIEIKLYDTAKKSYIFKLEKSKNTDSIRCEKKIKEFQLKEEENIFYISADRIGPEDVYDKYKGTTIGFQGENAIGFIAKFKDYAIDEKYIYDKDIPSNYTFLGEVNYWLKEIIGEKINADNLDKTDRSRATYVKDGQRLQVRNKNTGSGLSYVVSIIIMVLSIAVNKAQERPTFIIENPEIHLHPAAQIKLMRFLLFMSNYCQIIIETHSDHIIKHVIENNGQVIKIHNFLPLYYTKNSHRILPTITLGEIKWTVFDMPTIDFHISLYSYLQSEFGCSSPNKTDDAIRKTKTFSSNKKEYDTKSKRYSNFKGAISEYETLPTYMRNVIDHPKKICSNEPARRRYRHSESEFEAALKKSIEFMIDIIYEKGWQ